MMVARKKKTQSEEDRISQLPDHLICHILTHLSTKDSVRTSRLSTRWRTLWQQVPGLDLYSCDFSDVHAFERFGDMFFDLNKDSSIQSLCINVDGSQAKSYNLTPWADAVTKRRIQYLVIGILGCLNFHEIPLLPQSLYTCETLVHLRLYKVVLVDAEFFSLPCLKVMRLSCIRYLNVATLEKLISASQVLENLWIRTPSSEETEVLQVRSQTLKRIEIDDTEIAIDAPLLQCLRTRFRFTKNYKFISLGFPTKVDIDFGGMRKGLLPNIFPEFSSVRDLAISSYNWKYIFPHSGGPLIQLCCLSRLRATFYASDLEVFEVLPNLLDCCPKLEYLILELFGEPKMMFSTVPSCLVSSLKFVELKICVGEYNEGELNLVRYFLENSTILKKLSVKFLHNKKANHEIFEEQLVAMPRCSTACQVLLL